jgi:hypothetical protein
VGDGVSRHFASQQTRERRHNPNQSYRCECGPRQFVQEAALSKANPFVRLSGKLDCVDLPDGLLFNLFHFLSPVELCAVSTAKAFDGLEQTVHYR